MNRFQIILVFVILSAFAGCSSVQSPVTPDLGSQQVSQNSEMKSNRTIWGYWTIRIDPDFKTVEIVPDREVELHFNVVRLLEVDPCTDCLSISNLSWLPNNIVQCDFQLRHPFSDMVKLTGFDVRSVLVADGDTLFPESNRLVSLDGSNPFLLNPDGYTALFNPVEFPPDSAPLPCFGYIPGKLAIGDDFTGTLNPFMAFCTDNPRRMFEAGATETVTINLKYPSVPFEFGYVVDASWKKVDVVVDPVTDFPPEANCLEPYRLDFQMSAVLTDEIGDTAEVRVEVFDHQGIDTISTVSIECPSLFDGEVFLTYSSQSGDDSWLFDGVITNENGVSVGSYPVLARAISLEGDFNLGELAAYQIDDISVLPLESWIMVDYPNGGESFFGGTAVEILWSSDSVTGQVMIEYTLNDTQPPIEIIAATDNDGAFMWDPIPNTPTNHARVIITSIDDPAIWDQSDERFTIAEEKSLTVLDPNGGENLTGGESWNITWDYTGQIFDVIIELSTNGGNSYDTVITPSTQCDGVFEWDPIPVINTIEAMIKISDVAPSGVLDESDGVFTISEERSFTVLDPNGGETIYGSDSFEIQWQWTGILTFVDILYSTDSGANYDGTVVLGADCTGSYMWDPIPALDTTQARIKIIDVDNAATFDESDEDFTISCDDNLVWAKRAGGTDEDYGSGITTLSDNSTVVTGSFEGSATFGEGEANETVLVSNGARELFVARYNPDSTLIWAKRAGGTGVDTGNGITTLSDDSTVVTGYFSGSATFGEAEANETVLESNGWLDIFVARYNPDGTLAWAILSGGSNWDEGYGITTLSDDSTVVTGNFSGSATFGEDEPNETSLSSGGELDMFVARYNPDGTIAWAKKAGRPYYQEGYGITTLSDDSTVVTGYFDDSAIFGPGEANETVLVSYGAADIFVARYNPNGTLAWVKHSGGTDSDGGYGITTLSDDSTVVTGWFRTSSTFGEGDPNETSLVSDGKTDIFVVRYNPDGTLAWAKRSGGTDYDNCRGITTLSDDSTVVTGNLSSTATFGEGEPNETVLVSDGGYDIFVARHNPDGTLIWAKRAGGMNYDLGSGITALSDDSSVVTGYFSDSAIFGEGEPDETVLVSDGATDIFVARFAP